MMSTTFIPLMVASQNASRVAMNSGASDCGVSSGFLTFIVTLIGVGVLFLALYLIDRFL